MEFRRDKAVATLHNVVAILHQQWPTLGEETQPAVAALIRQYGPEIATEGLLNVVRPVILLLEGLWSLRAQLPQSVVQTLEAGRGASSFSFISVPADVRQALLDDLVQLVDFRAYQDPDNLARRLSALIEAHQDRLTDDERAQWRELDAAYRQNGDPQAYLHATEKLLGGHVETVRGMLTGAKTWKAESFRGVSPAYDISEDVEEAMQPKGPADLGEELVRYANVHFPATVLLSQKMVPLVVHVAQQFQAQGARVDEKEARITLRAGDLTIVIHPEGFEVVQGIGGQPVPGVPTARTVEVERERDCEPVVFFLNPQSPGRKKISIDIYQFDRNITTVAFETEVVAGSAITDLANVEVEPVPVVSPGEDAQPPDLELRVMLSADQRTLSYTLHLPGTDGCGFKPAGQMPLSAEPRSFFQPTLDRLSTLAKKAADDRTADETRRMIQELSDIGANLYDALFPTDLKREYRKLRERLRGKSLLITSDEPWVPWEMVKPFESDEDGEILYDDPPLCEMFRVSRWLAGRGAPDQVAMRHGVWVAPADNLQAAQEETDYFSELRRQRWEVSLTGPLSTLTEVEDRFRDGDTELFHFACHGNFDTSDPNESKLKLAGDFLRPSQITGVKRAGLRKSKPVVFLNACHSAETGFALTRLGGWAQRFVESGASAFIGSLWEINDQLAAKFAVEFYNRLWGLADHDPLPLGQAFHEARMVIKETDPANPTWLAYVLYGDPYGRVRLGAGA